MKRREFITLLGGAAAAWPLAVRAQQPEQMRRIGVLMGAAETASSRGWLAAFSHRLDERGWREKPQRACGGAMVERPAGADAGLG